MLSLTPADALIIAAYFGKQFSRSFFGKMLEKTPEKCLAILQEFLDKGDIIALSELYYQFSTQEVYESYRKQITQISNITAFLQAQTLYEQARSQRLQQSSYFLLNISHHPAIQSGNLNAALPLLSQELAQRLAVSRVSIWRYDKEQQHLYLQHLYEQQGQQHHSQAAAPLTAVDFPLYFKAVETQKPIIAPEAATHPDLLDFAPHYFPENNIYSLLDVPFFIGDQLGGVICCENQHFHRYWSDEDLALLSATASVISMTIKAAEVTAQTKAIAAQNVKLSSNEAVLKKAYERIKERENELKQANEQLQASEEELRQNMEELQATQEALNQKQETLEKANKKMIANEAILKKAYEQIKSREAEIKKAYEQVAASEEELRQNMEELQATQEALNQKQETLEKANRKMIANEAILKKAYEQIKSREAEIKKAYEQVAASEEELRQNYEELHATQEILAQSEAQIRSILDAIQVSSPVIFTNLDGTIERANALFLQLIGQDKLEQVIGTAYSLYDDKAQSEDASDRQWFEEFWQALRSGHPQVKETKLQNQAGDTVWLRSTFAPILDKQSKPKSIIIISQDISEIKAQQFQIEHQNQEILVQNEEMHQQQEEILAQRDFIEKKNAELEERDRQIRSSINAAMTIQEAILPYKAKLDHLLGEHFVIYSPKDMVSGDFYWLNEAEGHTILAAVDCTGHGVPGAFMSLIGNTLLDKIVRVWNITDPAEVLTRLHEEVRTVLRQEETKNNNGMDMVLISFQRSQNQTQLAFCGAKNSLYYILPQGQEVLELKGDRRAIGGEQNENKRFHTQHLTLPPGTLVYLGSDGIEDQNNLKRKKFGARYLRQILLENAQSPLHVQKLQLGAALAEHMAGTAQRDDMLLIGFKI
ncbi:SpoIIE family protein phosphatase [Eisenibacter elegans]|uniref:SpoIIE family protein phosphatase n=1 Tax=Eisenibacter elegans TaxID=997 RepID=UPI000412161C|nr:SpoIIE family protein phosphatase [Eisenibacter elegans]